MGRKGRDKFGAGSASRRRTVLQIEPVSRRKESEGNQMVSRKREINPTSISGIGLLGQYAEDSEDEEQKGSSSDEGNINNEEETTKPEKEVQIDSKLNDFFKEIEAIDTVDSKSTEITETSSQATTVEDSTLDTPADASAVDQTMQGYVLPEPWQQVCDPSTNYIYYWNTLTNEVSWELPQLVEYSQVVHPEVEQVEQSTLSQKETDNGNVIKDESSLNDKEPCTETKDGNEEEAESSVIASDEADEETVALPIHGPEKLPSADEVCASHETAKSSLSDNIVNEGLDQEERKFDQTTSSEECEKKKSSSISHKRERTAVIDMFESDSRKDDSTEIDNESKDTIEYWTAERMRNAVPEEMPSYPSTPENVDISAPSSPDKDDEPPALTPELDGEDAFELTRRSDKELENNDEDDSELPAKKAKIEEESDHESEGDFAEKLLEEFFEGKTTDATSSGDDMDVDSDDQQVSKEEAPLLPPEAFVHNRADRLQENGSASPPGACLVEVDKKVEEEDEKLTTEIHDLCQLLSNKLEFLNINKEGANKLLIVLVQMETRIKDWREGGLSSTYIVKKLREAAQELRSYEQSAVPEGWSCHWDRYCIQQTTSSMSRTNFLPCEIFQVKEKQSFWIIRNLTYGRRWKIFHSLTFQAFAKYMVSFILVYKVLAVEFCSLLVEDNERRASIEQVKRNKKSFSCQVSEFLANSQVVVFTRQKAVNLCIFALLCAFGLERRKILKQLAKTHSIIMSNDYVVL